MRRIAVLGRHGNTFEAGEKVVMVGAREDLPLTEAGRNQARAVGLALAPLCSEFGSEIGSVRAGPLRRTRDFASLILETLALSKQVSIDQRLVELDYGEWSGLSDPEIVALSGSTAALKAWQERGERPVGVSFTPSAEELERETCALLDDLSVQDGLSIVITSNGRLREVGRLLSQDPQRSWKVGTGKLCVLEYVNRSWRILGWDITPERLSEVLQAG
jgi:broad specificity phosphatase PhoE